MPSVNAGGFFCICISPRRVIAVCLYCHHDLLSRDSYVVKEPKSDNRILD
ncbi:hypothetical protein L7G72_12935 [Xenorhabdus bovienii]|nr:hypothetical protein [Xenorhabdus bovienii]MCG3462744.1 hypothetical protein [Xenorhabdus bovienii]